MRKMLLLAVVAAIAALMLAAAPAGAQEVDPEAILICDFDGDGVEDCLLCDFDGDFDCDELDEVAICDLDGDGIDECVFFDDGFEIEEAESGDIDAEVTVINEGDNVNQAVAVQQNVNTGNVQNIQFVDQFDVGESDDIEFEGGSIVLGGDLEQDVDQSISQATGVGWWWL